MGKRLHVLQLVLLSLVTGALGSLVAVGATQQPANACSVAGPSAEAWPMSNLRPGQTIEISGRSFYDVVFWDRPGQPDPALTANQPPVSSCDFDLVPMTDIAIVWHGSTTHKLGVVDGPDFRTRVTVPDAAVKGSAALEIGGVWIDVHVGPVIDPPPPCPLAAVDAGSVRHDCPDPWPCPNIAQAVPGGPDVVPGYPPRCPEPCADLAHTAPEGTVTNWRGDCPPPCAGAEVDPGPTGGEAAAIWCPDPCSYPAGADAAAALARYCPDPCSIDERAPHPCPEPCPVYATAGGGTSVPPATDRCPDPCGPEPAPAAAVWCPPEEPRPDRPLPDPPAIDATTGAGAAAAPPAIDATTGAGAAAAPSAAVTTAPGIVAGSTEPATAVVAIQPDVAHAQDMLTELSHRIVAVVRRLLSWTR